MRFSEVSKHQVGTGIYLDNYVAKIRTVCNVQFILCSKSSKELKTLKLYYILSYSMEFSHVTKLSVKSHQGHLILTVPVFVRKLRQKSDLTLTKVQQHHVNVPQVRPKHGTVFEGSERQTFYFKS